MRHFLIAGASGLAPGQSQDTEPAFLCLNNEDQLIAPHLVAPGIFEQETNA